MIWTPDQPLVSIKDVHKTFAGNIEVLKGITMNVMKRELVWPSRLYGSRK